MLPGLLIGHSTNAISLTGCTVLRFASPTEATAAISIQGSAPGTRETDSLEPINMIDKIHAIVLTGGSSYGLEAANGVMRQLERENIGKSVGNGVVVPIVASAVLFDLDIGDKYIRPDYENGIEACQNASSSPVLNGNIGAGTGATVGKILGNQRAMKSGIGSAFIELEKGIKLQALFAVNSIGNIIDENGKIIAGIRGEAKGSFQSAVKAILNQKDKVQIFQGQSTAIGVVAINIPLNKTQLKKVAAMAHDGMARAINPVHTMYDGDAIFAVSLPEQKFQNMEISLDIINLAGIASAEVTAQAIRNAIFNAKSVNGYPSHWDWCK